MRSRGRRGGLRSCDLAVTECLQRDYGSPVVEEEVGFRGDLGSVLPDASYVDHKGRTKRVRYWAMEAASFPEFVVNDEVDQIRWLGPADARRLLTYAHDRVVVDGFVATT